VRSRVAWAVGRSWLWAMGVLVFLLAAQPLLPLAAQAPTDPPDATPAALADYAAALATAQALLAAAGDDARALAAARRELAPFRTLQLPNGETVSVQPLLGAVDTPLTRADAAARLATARTQLQLAVNDQTAARLALLDSVWQLPEFTRGETLGERFLRWLSELLDGLLPDLQPDPAAQRATSAVAELAGWAIAAIAALVLLWLLGLWLRRFLGRFVIDAAAEQANGDAALPRTPAEARARADELARTGAYRDAVRNLYLAALLGLERRRLVPADRSLTNREVLAQVPAENALQPLLRPVVDTFDVVWYGVREPDAATFADYAAQIDGLEQVAAEETKTP
jgi:hypothetical protein